jgi:hypothetical protein
VATAHSSLDLIDLGILSVVIVAALVYISPFTGRGWQIYEDAAMLFRYADHVSDGAGIVWNVGEPPVDGATDLLFMGVLAGLHRFGLETEVSARLVGVASHVPLLVLIYVTMRTVASAGRLPAIASVIFVAVGPAKAYIAGGFGTPLFALVVGIAWSTALCLAFNPSMPRAVVCSCLCVLMGVARPEGALLGSFIVLSLFIYWYGRPESWRLLVSMVLTGAALGGAYWVWRLRYFGFPLPNPYYRKGGGQIYWRNALVTAKYGALLLGPFLLPLAYGLVKPQLRRRTLLCAIPIAGFLAMWLALSNEMNFFRRFQYPVVALAAMSWPLWIDARLTASTARERLSLQTRRLRLAMGFGAALAVLWYQHYQYLPPRWQDSLYELGHVLQPLRDRGFTMAVTEAGLLPYYSQWRTIDMWGLTDQWIAHHGVITPEYLDQQQPALIMFHAGCYAPGSTEPFARMIGVLTDYVAERPYQFVTGYGDSGGSVTVFYVRQGPGDDSAVSALLEDWAGRHGIQPARTPRCS